MLVKDPNSIRVTHTPVIPIDCGTIHLGHGGQISTHVSIEIMDRYGRKRTVLSRPGHSYLVGFLQLIYNMARQADSGEPLAMLGIDNLNESGVVSAATQADPCRVTVAGNPSWDERWVQISRPLGMVNLQGLHFANQISAGVFDLFTDETKTVGLDMSAEPAYTASSATAYGVKYAFNGFGTNVLFNSPEILLGYGTTAVDIQDFAPEIRDPLLSPQGQLIDEPIVGTTDSTLRLTRDFNNDTGGSITIEEMALKCRAGINSWEYIVIARDLITKTILAATPITLNYDVKTTVDLAAGGVLRQFNEILYRQLKTASRTVFDLDNVGQSVSVNTGNFAMVGMSGLHRFDPYIAGGGQSYKLGIIFGHTQSGLAVAIDNVDLADRIVHGTGTDELEYYGSIVDGYSVGATSAEFKVRRLAKNASGAQIDIDDIGLVCAGNASMNDFHLVSRYIHDGAGGRPATTALGVGNVVEGIMTFKASE